MDSIDRCRACGSGDLEQVIDLGQHRLSDFRETRDEVPAYPLTVVLCGTCGLAQLTHTVPRDLLYHPRYSFKSGVSEAVRYDLGLVVALARRFVHDPVSWLDIASNDGTLLAQVPPDAYRVGIDPLRQFAAEARTHADEIVVSFFDPALFGGRRFDVVTSVSMFYDLDNPRAFVSGVREVLAPGGVWVIQQNHLVQMIENTSVDNISHEHLAYYSLETLMPLLSDAGLRVVDVGWSSVNGGCFSVVVTHDDDYGWKWHAHKRIDMMLRREERARLRDPRTWHLFNQRVTAELSKLNNLVMAERASGKTFQVYGASTRGGTIWQAAGLTHWDIEAVVDRNPAKVGRWMSAINVPIISEVAMRADPPDYLLVGPWWLRDSFVEREHAYLAAGGRMVFPLPTLEVVTG